MPVYSIPGYGPLDFEDGISRERAYEIMGVQPPAQTASAPVDRSPFKAGLESAYGSLRYGLPYAIEKRFGEVTPEEDASYQQGLRDSAARAERLLPGGAPGIGDWWEGKAGLGQLVYENAAQSAPQMVATIAGSIAGGAAGTAMAGPGPGSIAGGILGGTAVATPFFVGSNVQRATEGGQTDLTYDAAGRSLAMAPLQGAADTLVERFLPVGPLAGRMTGGFLTRTGKSMLGAGLTESVTEPLQQVGERYAAGLPLGDDEAYREYGSAAGTAFLTGGALGAFGGFRRAPAPAPISEDEPTNLLAREAQPDMFGGADTIYDAASPAPADLFGSLTAERSRLTRNMVEAERAGDAATFYRLQDAVMQIDDQLSDPRLQQLARSSQRDAAFAADEPTLFGRMKPDRPDPLDRMGIPIIEGDDAFAAQGMADLLRDRSGRDLDRADIPAIADSGRDAIAWDDDFAPTGTQRDMFGYTPSVERDTREDVGGQAPVPLDGAGQPSLFGAVPTAGVRTGFGQREVLMRLRQAADFRGTKGKQGLPKETARGFAMKADGYTVSLANRISQLLSQGKAFEAVRWLDEQEEALQIGELKGKTIDERVPVLDAARQVVADYNSQMTDAFAQEARMREPQPGAQVSNDAPAEFVRQRVQQQQLEQAQAEQTRVDTIRTETLQDILENSAPQRVVQEFMKFVAGGKGQYGEVGLRENERAMLDQARQQRRMRAEVRDAFAQDEARQQKKVEGKQRGQLRERDFAQRRAERQAQQGAQPQSVPLSEATRETDAVAQMPAAEQVPTLDQLMERAAQPAARTPTVLDRIDGPQPTVIEKKPEPEPEPTPPKPPKKPLPKKETKGDKIKREVAERNKQTRERLTLKPKAEPKPTPKPAKRERSAAADKALDRIYDLSTNLDKAGLVRFASALRTKGQITPEDNAEIQRMSKDRDMGAEDIANELTTMVELADERTAKAEPAPEPKAAPEPDMQDDDSLSYDAVLEEAQSYLDGDSGALKAWQYNQLTKLATDKAVSPEALMDLLDAALEQSAKAAVGKSTGTKFREGEGGAGVSKASVTDRVASIVRNWKSKQRVDVIESLTELPKALANKVREAGQESAWGFVDSNGTVYLMSQNLPSLDVATATLYHETLGHIGLEKQFGERLDHVLEQMYNGNDRLRAEADGWIAANAAAYKGENLIARATEEALARRSENGPISASLMDKIVAVIKDFARRIGFNLKYSDNEVMAILAMAHTNITGGGRADLNEGLRYITTWHGSPHDHNKFDTKYIGSGEGNNAFGWGLYFSEERGVAEGYRDTLSRAASKFDFVWGGKPMRRADFVEKYPTGTPEYRAMLLLSSGGGDIERGAEFFRKNGLDEITIERLKEAAEPFKDHLRVPGRLYQVSTPDPQYMLRWFARLSDQPQAVKTALANLGIDVGDNRTAGADAYHALVRRYGSAKRASLKLLDAGVLGNMYPVDAMKGKREGPYNYVVFDGDHAKITAKFREAGTGLASSVESNINKLPENLRGPVYTITDTLGNAAQKGLVWAAFTEDLADMARNLIPASKDYVRLMMGKVVEREKLDRQINDIAERFQNLPVRFQNLGAGTVNGFIQDMDAAGEWAFKPTWLDKAGISYDFDSESDIAQRFEKLPKAAQDVIRDMFEQNFKLLRMKKETAEQSIAGTYNELISAAKARKADDEVKSLDADRKEALAEVARLMAIQENMPWASRRRYGDYVVVAKSKELKEAIANDEPPKVINDLKAQEDHYFVQRYETFAEAQAEARKLKESGLYATSLAREADKVADELVGGKEMMLAFQRLRDYIKSQAGTAGVNDKVLAGINRLAADLYIGALKSTSSRKAELRRLGVAGGDMDMMRNFVTQGRADAHFIGAMKFNEDILDAMNRMRREAGSDENENPQQAMRIYNEMMLRHLSGMSYTPSRLADMVKNATSSWMLTTNPSYYLQNLTQPWVLSLPYIAGKHGHSNATSNYLAAYRQIAKIWGERLSPLEIEKIADPNVRQAIEDLANRGAIDIGAEKDMGNFESLSKGPVANAWSRVSTALRNATRKTEAINRVATAMVAYQLERRAGATHEQAVDYAYRVNRLTNGSYDGFNAPRYMRGPVGSVLTQFKKFQLMQVTLLARLMHSSLKAADPVERAIARRTLAYTLGHTAVLAGAMGLPGMAAITWALNSLLGDDDEPADIEQSIRDAIGDEAIANLLLKGAPTLAGTDISSRVGMGQAFSVIPYVEPELNREGYEKTFTALAGPFFGGLLPKMVDGLGLMRDGDYYKGLARMLPNGLGNGINAMVEASDGVRKRNGDVLLTPEEIDFGQTFARLIGVQTTEVSERQRRTTREINIEQFYADRSKELNQRFAEARENNDVEEMSAIRKEWMSLQTKRVENGLKRQPVSSLMRYVKAKKRREDATVRGVQYRPGSPAYQRALDEADEE